MLQFEFSFTKFLNFKTALYSKETVNLKIIPFSEYFSFKFVYLKVNNLFDLRLKLVIL